MAWGYLTPPDESVREHVPLTQRPRRPSRRQVTIVPVAEDRVTPLVEELTPVPDPV